MMKRSFLFFMASLLLFIVVGCGTGNTTTDSSDKQNEITESTNKDLKERNNELIKKEKEIKKEAEKDEKKSDSKSKSNSSDKGEKSTKQENKQDSKSSTNSKTKSKQDSKNKDSSKSSSKDSASSSTKDNKQSKSSDTSKKQSPKQDKNKQKSDKPKKDKPKKDKTEKPEEKPVKPKKTVTVSVVTGDVKGTVLSKTNVSISDGDTVLDATQRILREKGIQISVRGSKGSAYVEGIDNLYEFDKGPLSGWHVSVNGRLIDRSAGAVTVKDGDSINWNYTTDYTKD